MQIDQSASDPMKCFSSVELCQLSAGDCWCCAVGSQQSRQSNDV